MKIVYHIYFIYLFIYLFYLFILKETSLEDRPFMTIKEIEDYGENSVSPVNYLILESLGEVSK